MARQENSIDPYQTPPIAASETGLHCLHMILNQIPSLKRINDWGGRMVLSKLPVPGRPTGL